jgi:hypothetical protein
MSWSVPSEKESDDIQNVNVENELDFLYTTVLQILFPFGCETIILFLVTL